MTKTVMWLVLAVAAGLGGGWLATTLKEPVQAKRSEARASAGAAGEDDARFRRLDERLQRLERFMDRLTEEAPFPRSPAPGSAESETDGEPVTEEAESASPGGAGTQASKTQAPKFASAAKLLEGIVGKPMDNDTTNSMFYRLSVNRERIDETIAHLEKMIKDAPNDAELQVALATAYTAKTAYGTPSGPQQGVVWAQADKAYRKALELNPNHWQAGYGQAFGTSMAPEFVGLRPQAIKQFESLVDQQETQAAHKDHVLAYMRLGTLYKDAGNVEKARTTWERGLKRFPQSKRLQDVVAILEK